MRRSGKGSGGGLGMNKVKHGKYGKAEPKPRAMSPGAINQFGAKVGDHATTKRTSSGYTGEELVRGKGYTPPSGPTDNVKAVGVGGGRKVYASGSQCQTGAPSPGNPMPRGEVFPGWGSAKK
jgi:hypothetical protein